MNLAKLMLIVAALVAVSPAAFAQLAAVSGEQRQADRDAIRKDIDKIFQAYIQKDRETIRATHAKEWRGFLESSRKIIQGNDQYMQSADSYLKSPGRLAAYKMLDFDVLFYGDVAMVPYIAEIQSEFQGQTSSGKLRVLDVYAKLGGKWTQIASDTGVHPDTLMDELSQLSPLDPDAKKELLAARESVWRAYFANDHARLEEVIPPETIAIDEGGDKWASRDDILAGAKGFAESGGKLVSLDFPRTEIQMYGLVAIVYSTYQFEIESNGSRSAHAGRATEMFVNRRGKWVNVGWHLDSGK